MLASICPAGAIRLVPTLMTIRMVVVENSPQLTEFENFPSFSVIEHRVGETGEIRWEGQLLSPAARMAFWQAEKSCRFGSNFNACCQRHQPLLRPGGELCSLPSWLSFASGCYAEGRVRVEARTRHC